MRIEATIFKWTISFASIKHFAWYLCQCILVALQEFILLFSLFHMVIRGNYKVTGASADGTRPKMMLGSPLVIGGSPRTNTLQTEYVVTLVQYSKLLPIGKDFL